MSSAPLFTRCKNDLDSILRRRFFIAPAFEIYGGVAGLFDFGPPGCALKSEIENLWRNHFILHENMLELNATCITPEPVLQASGHCERFVDFKVSDAVNGTSYRADKLLEEALDKEIKMAPTEARKEELNVILNKLDGMKGPELDAVFQEFKVKAPVTGNALTPAVPFNLMFPTSIGPNGDLRGFLRPETAQGIFVNFKRFLDFNGGRLPFAAAQLGLGFRNEIAPRGGLLRVREFQMAEIEHFVHPDRKEHIRFVDVAELKLPLFSAKNQLAGSHIETEISLGVAVKDKIVNNETLAYFMARTYLFLRALGIAPEGIRFRQHLPTAMAHYAQDCWDAEVLCSAGWVEVVGHADRSAYDLNAHSKATNSELVAHERLPEPLIVSEHIISIDKKRAGPLLRKDGARVFAALESASQEVKEQIAKQQAESGTGVLHLNAEGVAVLKEGVATFDLPKDIFESKLVEKKISETTFTPHVIEPSFGIGRIVHVTMEHAFRARGIEGQEARNYLSFPARVAPTKVSLLPISANDSFTPLIRDLERRLIQRGLRTLVDASSATLGRRYARTDEMGIPFGVTFDFETLKTDMVTIRDRDSMTQILVPIKKVPEVIFELTYGDLTWEDAKKDYQSVERSEE